YRKNLSLERQSRLLQFTSQLIYNLGEMVNLALSLADQQKAAEQTAEKLSLLFIEQCKQDIDRGAVKNVLSMYLIQILSGQPIDMDKILEIFAPILVRPQVVQDRAILLHRLEPLIDLLRSIPHNDLANGVRKHLEFMDHKDVQFDPSLLSSNAS